jgi:hypothetical protein
LTLRGHGEGEDSLGKVNDSDLWQKKTVLWLAVKNGGGESVELVSTRDASLRSTTGGGKCCAAERPVLGTLFILWGGARQGIIEL